MIDYFTVPELCQHFAKARHHLEHALKRDQIQPAQRVGNTRLYHHDQLPAIADALERSFHQWRDRGRRRQAG